MVVSYPVVSKRVIGPIPDRPAQSAFPEDADALPERRNRADPRDDHAPQSAVA